MSKKVLAIALAAVLILAMITGCGGGSSTKPDSGNQDETSETSGADLSKHRYWRNSWHLLSFRWGVI